MLAPVKMAVAACCLVNDPVPLMALAIVAALARSITNAPLLVTPPDPKLPVLVLLPTLSVPPLMVVLA